MLPPTSNGRIDYDLLLSPGDGAPLRPLYDFQHLESAGLRNNATVYVRTRVYGGAPFSQQGKLMQLG